MIGIKEVEGNTRRSAAIRELATRIQGEYREMPGLCLTAAQAERLWGLERDLCAMVLAQLIDRGILRRTPVGTYVRVRG